MNRKLQNNIKIKLLKTLYKEKINIEKNDTLPIRAKQFLMTYSISLENVGTRTKWHNTFQLHKAKNCQLQIPYLAKTSFWNEGEFSHEGKIRISY